MTMASLFGATSCSDMLEVDSDRQLVDPSINQKTDSIFYAFGVLQAVQQVADQYVFAGEMRGDLVKTSDYTDDNLRQLYNFTATSTNKYDSAYVYYRIINNCNYYIAHRDTSLMTGSTQVVMPEYAAIKAYRAWAYLQLVRTYKRVPFFTEPLTAISQIDDSNFPEMDLNGIVNALAPDLKQYADMSVPTSGINNKDIGTTNFGEKKNLYASKCYIPVALILGDLYLENGQYPEAAQMYARYLINNEVRQEESFAGPSFDQKQELPQNAVSWVGRWSDNRYSADPSSEIITYIPMPVNSRQGVTTAIPAAFGFNYYATKKETQVDEVQVLPSTSFRNLVKSQDYYYNTSSGSSVDNEVYEKKIGDTRFNNYMTQGNLNMDQDSTMWWMDKYNHGNIVLYRQSTVYLRLAEALNRMGYPDAAFAILKDGISDRLLESSYTYITDKTRELLQTQVPFFSQENKDKFSYIVSGSIGSGVRSFPGVLPYGSGITYDGNFPGSSPYQLDTIVVNKIKELSGQFSTVQVPQTADGTMSEIWGQLSEDEVINAVEDLICDEYALEASYEGSRFYDLIRMARHKNEKSPAGYGANFGTEWLVKKLSSDGRDANVLYDENKWYLPFN
mgnify:CR=1 FL=1